MIEQKYTRKQQQRVGSLVLSVVDKLFKKRGTSAEFM